MSSSPCRSSISRCTSRTESWNSTLVSTIPWQISSAPFSPLGEVDRRALAICLGILLRQVEDVRGVAVVVVRPVCHGAQRRAGREHVRRREHRHQRDEAAVASAVDADPPRVDLLLARKVFRAVDDVLEILAAHVAVDGGPPVAAVAGAGAIVDVEHHVAARRRAGCGTCTRGSSSPSSGARSARSRRRGRRPRLAWPDRGGRRSSRA